MYQQNKAQNPKFIAFLAKYKHTKKSAIEGMARLGLAKDKVYETNSDYQERFRKKKLACGRLLTACVEGTANPTLKNLEFMQEFFKGCSFEELKAAIKGEEFVAKTKIKTTTQLKTQLDNRNLNYYLNYFIKCSNKLKVKTSLHFDYFNDMRDWEGLAK